MEMWWSLTSSRSPSALETRAGGRGTAAAGTRQLICHNSDKSLRKVVLVGEAHAEARYGLEG